MEFTVFVNLLPQDEILDPAGKATLHGLQQLGFSSIDDIRIGKRIRLKLSAPDATQAHSLAEEAARKLLANLIVERYEIEVHPLPNL